MPQDRAKGSPPKTEVATLVYIMKATQALSEVRSGIKRTMKCPTCDKLIGRADGKHVVYMGFVVITCNGYWVIDPNKLGIERPKWQPASDESLVRGSGSLRSWKEVHAAAT
jgi:hypothetical protein